MPNAIGYGERIPLKRGSKLKSWISKAAWSEIEGLAGIDFQDQTRKKINLYMQVFGCFGPIYCVRQSALTKDALTAIESFRKASQRLHETLVHEDADLEKLLPNMTDNQLPRLSGLTSVGQVIFSALLADAACQSALNGLSDDKRNGKIHHDLWAAWVCLIIKELTKVGFSITGTSSDMSNNESPPVRALLRFQQCLPPECHRAGTYETMRVMAQQANAKLGRLEETTLLQIIAGWGSQLLSGYPGPLMSAPNETIAEFDEYARQIRDEARLRVNKSKKGNS